MKYLLAAIMYQTKELLDKTISLLTKEFGPVKLKSHEYDFNFTSYYEPEFGKNLKKIIIIFEKSIEKHDLIQIRDKTEEIENKLKENNKRTVNIDPGYISESELVLATKKGKPWKEFLGEGIYAHKIMEFKEDKIITFNHTFKDYKLDKNLIFFKKARNSLF